MDMMQYKVKDVKALLVRLGMPKKFATSFDMLESTQKHLTEIAVRQARAEPSSKWLESVARFMSVLLTICKSSCIDREFRMSVGTLTAYLLLDPVIASTDVEIAGNACAIARLLVDD